MNRFLAKLCTLAALTTALSGCGKAASSTRTRAFDVTMIARSDDGVPVQGATFATGRATMGTTDERGAATVVLQGVDGQTIAVRVTCPEAFDSPEESSLIRLTEVRSLSTGESPTLKVEAVCTRKFRDVVVVVRTVNAPSLPVDIAGKTMGETDSNGIAHYRLQLGREVKRLSVTLGTVSLPLLRPQHPSRIFELSEQDSILIVEQSFSVERKPATKKGHSPSPKKNDRAVPYRIGT